MYRKTGRLDTAFGISDSLPSVQRRFDWNKNYFRLLWGHGFRVPHLRKFYPPTTFKEKNTIGDFSSRPTMGRLEIGL